MTAVPAARCPHASQDAWQFQVLASNYPPDYGIASAAPSPCPSRAAARSSMARPGSSTARRAGCARLVRPRRQGIGAALQRLRLQRSGPVFIPHVYNRPSRRPSSSTTKSGANWFKASRRPRSVTVPGGFGHSASDFNYVIPSYNSATAVIVPQVQDPGMAGKIAAHAELTPASPSRTTRFPATCWIPMPCSSTAPRTSRGDELGR